MTIVSTALVTITSDLHDFSKSTWIINSYLVIWAGMKSTHSVTKTRSKMTRAEMKNHRLSRSLGSVQRGNRTQTLGAGSDNYLCNLFCWLCWRKDVDSAVSRPIYPDLEEIIADKADQNYHARLPRSRRRWSLQSRNDHHL